MLKEASCVVTSIQLCELVVTLQEDMEMTKDGFTERFGDLPRKDDITILAPKREDPTEQARISTCYMGAKAVAAAATFAVVRL